MKMQTYGQTIVMSDSVEITNEEYKKLANHYTKALAQSMLNTKLALEESIYAIKPSYEIEVDFDE